MTQATPPLPIVVLISGNGGNLQAIIDAVAAHKLPVEIRAVISSHATAYGLKRAQLAHIATEVLAVSAFSDRASYDQALQQIIDRYQPKLVVLAGFMRILSAAFVQHYHGRLFNIHPSLLPKYRGLHTHEKVLAAADREHGATVHFVTEELDGGPSIIQAKLEVMPDDTADSLEERIHTLEHIIYPQAIQWFAEGRLQLQNQHVLLNGQVLPAQGYQAKIMVDK